MSTRATIACRQDDGRYAAIYLHFDGYPEHAGKILDTHYSELTSVHALIAGGDIRSIERDGSPERFTNGNRMVIMPTHETLFDFARNCDAGYLYIFEEDAWHCHRL